MLLWTAMQHRGPDGAFGACLGGVDAPGYAVVVPDVDALLRREAPFTRGGQTTLRLTAPAGLFLGLAPRADVDRYLTGVPGTRLARVRLARGPLPVDTVAVAGSGQPASPPGAQHVWYAVGHPVGAYTTLSWSPSAVRGRQLALVVMNVDGRAGVDVPLTVTVNPRWLNPTTWGLVILGSVLLVLATAVLLWPWGSRDVVYVVEPSQVPEIAARLGVPAPAPVVAAPVSAPALVVAAPAPAPAAPAPVRPDRPLPPAIRPELAWPPTAGRATPPVGAVAAENLDAENLDAENLDAEEPDPAPEEAPEEAPDLPGWVGAAGDPALVTG